MSDKAVAPLHPFEVKISIGANTHEFITRALTDILRTFEAGGMVNGMSGGWDGSYAVTTHTRDISPDAYRQELEKWFDK